MTFSAFIDSEQIEAIEKPGFCGRIYVEAEVYKDAVDWCEVTVEGAEFKLSQLHPEDRAQVERKIKDWQQQVEDYERGLDDWIREMAERNRYPEDDIA